MMKDVQGIYTGYDINALLATGKNTSRQRNKKASAINHCTIKETNNKALKLLDEHEIKAVKHQRRSKTGNEYKQFHAENH